ncbi:MBL fold metallo-hydrolase [bacterium]|nr:MBL fold metallo-hydrolase [bacterium]
MPADICMQPWKYHVKPFRIAGNLYYVGNSDVSSHLIDTGQGLILLDTAFPQTVYLLLESIRRLGFNPDDIRYILHCHGHYDHFGGTRAIVELTGAKTALGEDDIEILKARPELSWAPEYGVEFYETFEVDEPLVDGQIISLGNISIDCLHIPGHTPGSMSYFFEINDGGNTYTVGIHGGPGLNTLSEEYLSKYELLLSRRTDYMNSLQQLKKREVDVFIGAHPGQNATLMKQSLMKDGKNPFLDKTAWQKFLETLEESAKTEFGIP